MKLKNTLALSLAAVMAAGLTACGSSADTASAASPAADSTAAESTEAAADTAAPDGDGDPTTLTVAMECAYAPNNWQESEATDSNVPVENVAGTYAEGYDVQIAKIDCKALGGEPVAVKQSFSGLIDSLNNGQIDLIIAGMSATPERERTSSVTPSSSSSDLIIWLTADCV